MKHTLRKVQLENGIKGIFVHIPDATVMYHEFNFRAGEYLVERPKWETAHLMEHVLLGANEKLPRARTFQAEFEKNGAYCNASTSTYDINYEAECADFEWDRITKLLLTAISKPLFLEEEFQAEFGNVREELTARSNNHFRNLSLSLREAYGFYSVTDQERLELMDNVTLKDIRAHYKATHFTRNMRFVIAGNLPPDRQEQIVGMLEAIDLPTGNKRLVLPYEKPVKLDAPLYLHNETVDNLYFYIDTYLPRRLTTAEDDALGVANILLTETFYSRILGTAREKGLVYDVSSGSYQTRGNSNWWIGAQIMPENAPALFDIIVKEVRGIMGGGVSAAELKRAKQYWLGKYQRSEQTVAGTAGGYAWRYFFDNSVMDYYDVPVRIEAVTKQAVVSATKAMFSQDIGGFGVLGSCGQAFTKELHSQIQQLWQ